MGDRSSERIARVELSPEVSLFDFQVNGFAGVDFQSRNLELSELQHAVSRLRWHRMQRIFLTLVTDTIDEMCRKLEALEANCSRDPDLAKTIVGYHLEGPWISSEEGYNGAHPLDKVCRPKESDLWRLWEASGGRIKLITLAPEVKDAIPMIELITGQGIRVGLGHTNAGERDIDDAISAGATLATHLGNAVPSLLHRQDNVIQRLLSRDELIACLIPDGVHLPPFVLRNFFRTKAPGKTFFTTDCMAAAGAPPGRFTLADIDLEVGEDGIVHLPGDSRFAGSSLTLDRGVIHIAEWLGVSSEEAVTLCSSCAADHFGLI